MNTVSAHAGVSIGGTRLLFSGGKKEASLTVSNQESSPYLIQSWVDPLDNSATKVPFVITPPLFRLDGQQQNILRIVKTGTVPENQESMYWLSVKSIPSAAGKPQANTLQIAVRTRIKLIYRPEALSDSTPEQQAEHLIWTRSGDKLSVKNPSGYYINFNEIALNGSKIKKVTWAAPNSTTLLTLPVNKGGQLTWTVLNDFGSAGKTHKTQI
ncbi:molecular chaperone [Citrobacter sp. R56]|uniref:fimbrial biogenesis chaperone n=1 Tax=Citrobacter sp. R56 TaxID=1573676 RepID=UPI001EEE4347|nr:fimbria/pilus periplasmic chaperone [Citrobacter sp. R56]